MSLMVHCGGVRRTRSELATLQTPEGTRSWRPIPHHSLVQALHDGLAGQGVEVVREDYCTMGKDDAKLLGSLDLRIAGLDTPDFSMGLGLRASNDKTVAVQLVCAARVFVCDNWAFAGSGGAMFLKKRHTARLDVRRVVPGAIDQFLEKAEVFRRDIDRMRDFDLPDERAKALIHDGFASGVLPLRLFGVVSNLYFRDPVQRERFPGRTLWSLNNSMTEAVKALKPAPRESSGRRIGRFFSHVIRRKDGETSA